MRVSVSKYLMCFLIYSMGMLRSHLHAMQVTDKLIVDSDHYTLVQGEYLLLHNLCYFIFMMITCLDRTSCYSIVFS